MISHATAQLLSQLRALDVRLRVEDGRLIINVPKGGLTPGLEAKLLDQKQELLQALVEQSGPARRSDIKPVSRTAAPLRLSFLQERLWVLEQLQPGQTVYNLAVCSTVMEDVDVDLLVTAIRRTIARNEILRSRFVLNGALPEVKVATADATPIALQDLRGLTSEALYHALNLATREATKTPFDLVNEAPVRFTVLQVADDSAAVLFATHHIAMDAWSLGVLGAQVISDYQALRSGSETRPAPDLQYLDYAHWQREQMAGSNLSEGLAYWTKRLSGLPRLSTFPPDRPRGAESAGVGDSYDFEWSPELYAGVRTLARETNSTTYMVLLAAMAVVLTRNAAQADVVIGSPIGTRALAELEGMLGPIINPLALRFDLADDPSFATVVERARDGILDGHQHQDVPFEVLVQTLNPERSLANSPLFQVAVVLHNAPNASDTRIFGGGAIYDMTVFALERDGVLSGTIEYRADLYDAATVGRINAQLQAVLTSACRDSAQRVSEVSLLSSEESDDLLATLTRSPVNVDRTTVVAQFARMAAECPSRTAVRAPDGSMTYAELHRRSSAVARDLRAKGVERGNFVALACDRSLAMVVGALGVLKAGAAYVPIDSSYPAERVLFMLHDSGVQHAVTTGDTVLALRSAPRPPTVIRIDQVAPLVGDPDEFSTPIGADDLAYLIYTSGSTGRPKGVRVPHGALSNFLAAMRERPGISAADAVLSVTSLSFDISVLEVFLPLVTGARVEIASREQSSNGAELAELIDSTKVTIVQATPSGYRLLMQARWKGGAGITAIVGGETLPGDVAEWLGRRVARVFNAYGPTETTVWSSLAEIEAAGPITVGTPVVNTRIYVLDGKRRLCPVGVPGEIYIAGDGVADGYHGRPELTAELFVADPFHQGSTMFRTGDYGRWLANGQLDHLGRLDGQVKLRGYRIETGEIESALLREEFVRAAVVGVRNAAADDPRLVAWVQLRPDADCTSSELRRALRQSLPEFMIPSMFMFLDAVPMTPNNKIDRAALPEPYAGAQRSPRASVPPSTATERLIAEVWTELLGVPAVGITDSFFELGGHSLLAMQAAATISKRTGRFIEPRLLFFRTLGEIAAACDAPVPASNRVARRA